MTEHNDLMEWDRIIRKSREQVTPKEVEMLVVNHYNAVARLRDVNDSIDNPIELTVAAGGTPGTVTLVWANLDTGTEETITVSEAVLMAGIYVSKTSTVCQDCGTSPKGITPKSSKRRKK